MARIDNRTSAELYLSWEDLLAEEEDQRTQPPERDASASAQLADLELPSDLKALVAEKERLEKELKRLTGDAAPDPEDVRRQQMFPVKVHTKESRIEERRLRKRDELMRMQAQRVLERRRIAARIEQRRAQLMAQLQRDAIEAQRVRERWARERRAALLEAARERALEAEWLARRERLREFRAQSRAAVDDRRLNGDGSLPGSAQQAAAQSKIDEQHAAQRAKALARSAAERVSEEARERQRSEAFERAAQRREEAQARDQERERQRLAQLERAREKRAQRAL
jgi:hypothetical protein